MQHKCLITCKICGNFLSSIDHSKEKQLHVSINRIVWICNVCSTENRFKHSSNICLVQKAYLRVKRSTSISYLFVIDMKSLNPSQSYTDLITSIRNKEGNLFLNAKCPQLMFEGSAILNNYFSFLRCIGKVQRNIRKYSVSYYDLVIAFLEDIVTLEPNQGMKSTQLQIEIISEEEKIYKFSFNYLQSLQQRSQKLLNFTKIFALLQMKQSKFLHQKIYKKQLDFYVLDESKQNQSIQNLRGIILIGNDYEWSNSKTKEQIDRIYSRYSIQLSLQSLRNVIFVHTTSFSSQLHSLSQISKYYIKPCSIFSKIFQEQIRVIYSHKLKKLAYYKAPLPIHQKIKNVILDKSLCMQQKQYQLEKLLTSQIENDSQHKKIRLIKLRADLNFNNEQEVIFMTFSWNKLEKMILYQELDSEAKDHKLRQDILNDEQQSYSAPSPFLKKNKDRYHIQANQKASEEDDLYEYL